MEGYWSWITLGILVLTTLGTVLPFLPGLPIMALTIITYGWLEGFQAINPMIIGLTLTLTLLGLLAEYLLSTYTAKRLGASKEGVWGVFLGGIIGILSLGPLGIIFGPFVGAIIGEIISGKGIQRASKVGIAAFWGMLLGNLLQFIFAVIILITFIIRVF